MADVLWVDNGNSGSQTEFFTRNGLVTNRISINTVAGYSIAQFLEYKIIYFPPNQNSTDRNTIINMWPKLRAAMGSPLVVWFSHADNNSSPFNNYGINGEDYSRPTTGAANAWVDASHPLNTGVGIGGVQIGDLGSWGSTWHGVISENPASLNVVLTAGVGQSPILIEGKYGSAGFYIEDTLTSKSGGWGSGNTNFANNCAKYAIYAYNNFTKTLSMRQAFPIGTMSIGGGAGVVERGERELETVSSGASTVTFGSIQKATYQGDIVVTTSAPNPSDITLNTEFGPGSLASTPAGQSSASMDVSTSYSTHTYIRARSWTYFTLGATIFPDPSFSHGVGAFTSNSLQIVLGSSAFVLYPSSPPHRPQDLTLAPATGPGTPEGLIARSNGEAGGSWTLSHGVRLSTRSDGVATVTAMQMQNFSIKIVSRGISTKVAYLGSPVYISMLSVGRATHTVYLGSPLRFELTAAGRATSTQYLSSRIYIEIISRGRAAVTKHYMGSRVYLDATTSRGRATVTIYTSSRVYVASTSRGQAVATFNLSGRVELYMRTSLDSGAGGAWYLASRVVLVTTSRGVGYLEFKSDNFGQTTAYGRATVTMSPEVFLGQESRNRLAMVVSAGCNSYHGFVADKRYQHADVENWSRHTPGDSHNFGSNSGFTGLEGVRFYQIGVTYSHAISRGVSTMVENEEFMPWNFKTTINAGCRLGLPSNQVAIRIYLSSQQHFRNNDPFDDWRFGGGQSTFQGKGTFDIEPDFEFKANAGCRVGGNHYRADDDPAFFNTSGSSRVPYAGVKMFQTGITYMHATTHNYYFTRPTLVHITLSAPQRLRWTARGVGTMRFNREGVWIADGVGGAFSNYINVASYDLQEWHSFADGDGRNTLYPDIAPGVPDPRVGLPGGVGRMEMYGAGRTEQDVQSNGVGGMPNYLNGPVYLGMFSDGVSGPNWLDVFGFNQEWTADAGVYPYTVVREPTVDEPGGQVDTFPGIIFEQDRLDVFMSWASRGRAHMEIEIDGVPIIRWIGRGVATVRMDATSIRNYYGFTAYAGSYGYITYYQRYPIPLSGPTGWSSKFSGRAYGVEIEQFQRRDFEANGVGSWKTHPLGLLWELTWQTWDDGGAYLHPNGGLSRRAGGWSTVTLRDDRVFFESRSETNLHYWQYDQYNGNSGYRLRSSPIYSPDRWHLTMRFLALEMRSRGRGRARDKMAGDLLSRYYSTPAPGTPTIDGHARPAHGQYWPRKIVLPWYKVPVTHPQWHEYEYYRR